MSIFWWKNMMDEQDARQQLRQQNKNIEASANNMSALALKEGSNQQFAYNWATSMVNKYKNNPQLISGVGQQLNQNLSRMSELASDWRLKAAQTLLTKRVVPKYNFLSSFVGGNEKALGDTAKLAAAVAPMITGLPPNPGALQGFGESSSPITSTQWQNDSMANITKSYKQSGYNPFNPYQ